MQMHTGSAVKADTQGLASSKLAIINHGVLVTQCINTFHALLEKNIFYYVAAIIYIFLIIMLQISRNCRDLDRCEHAQKTANQGL